MKQNTIIDLQSKMRPIRDDKGCVLDDVNFAKQALSRIDEYQKTHKTPPNITPKFIHWLRKGVQYVESGKGTMADYKQENIMKEMDYDMVCANTDARNSKLERKGEFKTKVVQQVKGVAK